MAIPDLQKLRDPTGKVAIRPEKSDGSIGTALDYDVTSAEWQISGDRVLTTSDVGSSGGLLEEGDNISLTTNASTGGTVISTESLLNVDGLDISTAPTTSESETVYFAGFDQSDDTTIIPELTAFDDSSVSIDPLKFESNLNSFTYGDFSVNQGGIFSAREVYYLGLNPIFATDSFVSGEFGSETDTVQFSFGLGIGLIVGGGSGSLEKRYAANVGNFHETTIRDQYSSYFGSSIRHTGEMGAPNGLAIMGTANEDLSNGEEFRLILAAGESNFDPSNVDPYNAYTVDNVQNHYTNFSGSSGGSLISDWTLSSDPTLHGNNILYNTTNNETTEPSEFVKNIVLNSTTQELKNVNAFDSNTVINSSFTLSDSVNSTTVFYDIQNSTFIGDFSRDTSNFSSNLIYDGWVFINDNLAVDNNKVVKLTEQNTADTSGDIQIRDDSDGDLFSLDDGNSPQLAAKYEGDNAFTFGVRSGNVGSNSTVIGGESFAPNEVPANWGFAGGRGNTVTGNFGFAHGTDNVIESGAYRGVALGSENTLSGNQTYALGSDLVKRTYTGSSVGRWNEDYLGSGNEQDNTDQLQNNSRIFAVGVGDDPNASSGGFDYFDGRGRVDGLYVTMRDGTHIRHGLSVDGYNASLGSYETVFEVDSTGTIVKGSVSPSVASSVNPAGPDDAVQFNDNQDFGGSSDLTWDGTNLTVNGKYQLTDSTGTYDAIEFETSEPNFFAGSIADIATRSGAETYIGASDPSTIPSSSIGSQNFIVGSQVLQNSSINGTLKFSNLNGNFVLGSSTIGAGSKIQTSVYGFAAGFGATLDNTTSTIGSSDVFVLAFGDSSLRGSNITQAGNILAVGSNSLRDASGDFGATACFGNLAGFESENIKRSVIIGDRSGAGTKNLEDVIIIGDNAGSSSNTGTVNDITYQQPPVSNSVVIGSHAVADSSNQFVVGAAPEQNPAADGINEVIFGDGPFANNPTSVTITTTDVRSEPASVGVNGDKSGGDMVISSGKGTGTGTPSAITFRTPTITGNTYDQQSLVKRFVVDETGVNVHNGDVEITEPGSGTIITSPDGTRFRVHVENDGTIVSTELS